MQRQFYDKTLIQAFVSHLAKKGHPGLQVDRRPDDKNRQTADIDANVGLATGLCCYVGKLKCLQ